MKLKFIGIFLFGMITVFTVVAQQPIAPGSWTWMKGSDTIKSTAVYGTKGIANALNTPPGREGSNNWVDSAGNFWVFSGRGVANGGIIAGYLNDLWRFNPETNEWTWVKGDTVTNAVGIYGTRGVSAPGNIPGGRYRFPTWKDAKGDFWLFGGLGAASSLPTSRYLNDLWRYSPVTNEWTWISGQNISGVTAAYGIKGVSSTGNMPGSREGSAGWIDTAGNFWIFGGNGYANSNRTTGALNDLWKYNITTGEWTWIHGDSSLNMPGIYDTKGTAAAGNTPSARRYASYWTDKENNLWLYGGAKSSGGDVFNDLWKYNVATNEWTWIHGDSTANSTATYTTKLIADVANTPGARQAASAWTEKDGTHLWLMNGSRTGGYLNDLWLYSTTNNTWTWVTGDTTASTNGVYGKQGVEDPANKVATRAYVGGVWSSGKGNLWLFGGNSKGAAGNTFGFLNDVWKLNLCYLLDTLSAITGPDSLCRNMTATYSVSPTGEAETYIWTLPPGWTGSSTTEQITVNSNNTGGTISVKAVNYCDTTESTLDVYVADIDANINVNEFVLGTTAPYNTYQWFFNGVLIPGATDSTYTVPENGDYTVAVTDERGCTDTSDIYKVTNVVVGIDEASLLAKQVKIYPNPSSDVIHIAAPWKVNVTLTGVEGKVIRQEKNTSSIRISDLADGIYLLQIMDAQGNMIKTEKFIKNR